MCVYFFFPTNFTVIRGRWVEEGRGREWRARVGEGEWRVGEYNVEEGTEEE